MFNKSNYKKIKRMDNNLANVAYWESLNRNIHAPKKIIFSKIFKSFLLEKKISSKNIALEIGCVPGIFLGYLCKNFGYFPEGIDFVKDSKKITQGTLKKFGINKSIVYEEDFLGWKPTKKYDLVCSFGFIEHFKDTTRIILKHVTLLNFWILTISKDIILT